MSLIGKEISELLVDNGLVTEEQLAVLEVEKQSSGDTLSQILTRLGFASENQLKDTLELNYGVTYVSLSKFKHDLAAIKLLPEHVIRLFEVIPLSLSDSSVYLAMVNPEDDETLEYVRDLLKVQQVKKAVCLADDLQKFVDAYFSGTLSLEPPAAEVVEPANSEPLISESAAPQPETEPVAPVSRVVKATTVTEPITPPASTAGSVAAVAAPASVVMQVVPSPAGPNAAQSVRPDRPPLSSPTVVASTQPVTAPPTIPAPKELPTSSSNGDALAATASTAPSTVDIGDLLVEKGLIDDDQLFDAMKRSLKTKKPVPDILIAMKLVTREQIDQLLIGEQEPSPSYSADTRDGIETDSALNDVFESSENSRPLGVQDYPALEEDSEFQELVSEAQYASISLLADHIMSTALDKHCSDVHIEAVDENVLVKYVDNGNLLTDIRLMKQVLPGLCACFKDMTGLDRKVTDQPQDRRVKLHLKNQQIELRVTTIPEGGDEMIAISIKYVDE